MKIYLAKKVKKQIKDPKDPDLKNLTKEYGKSGAHGIKKRIAELQAAPNLSKRHFPAGARLHGLHGEWKDCFAVWATKSIRVVFEPLNGNLEDLTSVTKIEILMFGDYH